MQSIILFAHDITEARKSSFLIELRNAETGLSTEKLKLILESMNEGVVVVNSAGETILKNSSAGQLLGEGVNSPLKTEDALVGYCVYEDSGSTKLEADDSPLGKALIYGRRTKGPGSETSRSRQGKNRNDRDAKA